jgi:hypothetical protein
MARKIEDSVPPIKEDGYNSAKNITTSANLAVGGTSTFTGVSTFTAAPVLPIRSPQEAPLVNHTTKAAINTTATATAAEVATGYITSTSAAGVSITMPTGTLLGAALGATQGTVFDLFIDNTAGANTVTLVAGTNAIVSDAATTTAASFGDVTVGSGVTGLARFTLMFSSATAYVYTRTA